MFAGVPFGQKAKKMEGDPISVFFRVRWKKLATRILVSIAEISFLPIEANPWSRDKLALHGALSGKNYFAGCVFAT